MRAYFFILVFCASLMGESHSQSLAFNKQTFWWSDLVTEIMTYDMIEFSSEGLILHLSEGDSWVVWNASGVIHEKGKAHLDGSVHIPTDYLLSGKYFVGVKTEAGPVMKEFDKVVYAVR